LDAGSFRPFRKFASSFDTFRSPKPDLPVNGPKRLPQTLAWPTGSDSNRFDQLATSEAGLSRFPWHLDDLVKNAAKPLLPGPKIS
jgi:hypothetical protein